MYLTTAIATTIKSYEKFSLISAPLKKAKAIENVHVYKCLRNTHEYDTKKEGLVIGFFLLIRKV